MGGIAKLGIFPSRCTQATNCKLIPSGQRCLPCSLYMSSLTLGGSVVILMPRWRMAMGKAGEGEDDSHSLQAWTVMWHHM
jgi:hypothetical protein